MKALTMIGAILLALGAVGLIWGGVKYFDSREEFAIGDVEIVVQEREVPPEAIAGGIAVVAGGVALAVGAMGNRRD